MTLSWGLDGFEVLGPSVSLVVTILVFAALWRVSIAKTNCGVVDLYWGFGFAVIAWLELAISGRWDGYRLAFIALVTAWALRLGWHLVHRHSTARGEDARYRLMRERNGPGWPNKSFWMVFMLQAVILWIIAAPIHMAFAGPSITVDPILVAIGIFLFVLGFVLEWVADAALAAFRRDSANHGRLLTTGVFSWSRHPNYFGEAVLWWGLGIFAYGLSGSFIALLGPAILHFLLVKVSGIPMLEEQLSTRPGFAAYAERTSAFIPRPPFAASSEAGCPVSAGSDQRRRTKKPGQKARLR
jgi:steroid 5-alpha reductase family enzyme